MIGLSRYWLRFDAGSGQDGTADLADQSCLDSIATVQREAAKAELVDKTDEPSN